MLLCSSALLLYVFLSLPLLPDQLVALPRTLDEWYDAFCRNWALSLLTSLVLIDGLKVGLLTLLSLPSVEHVLRSSTRLPRVRKPMRLMHKLVDVVLD